MRRPVGFLVWNPSRALPTVQHETYARADAEACRLRDLHPGETFFVMAPVTGAKATTAALAFSDGKAEGLAQAHAEIMLAEGRADRLDDEGRDLRRRLERMGDLTGRAAEYQATIADCLLWFDGFMAAHHNAEPCGRPYVPHRDKLVRLNEALQRLMRDPEVDDEEIPF